MHQIIHQLFQPVPGQQLVGEIKQGSLLVNALFLEQLVEARPLQRDADMAADVGQKRQGARTESVPFGGRHVEDAQHLVPGAEGRRGVHAQPFPIAFHRGQTAAPHFVVGLVQLPFSAHRLAVASLFPGIGVVQSHSRRQIMLCYQPKAWPPPLSLVVRIVHEDPARLEAGYVNQARQCLIQRAPDVNGLIEG